MERKIKVTNKNLVEMLIGRLIILLVESAIGCGLILGFFWVLGMITTWAEQSTFRMVVFFLITGTIIAKMLKKELE